MPNSFTNAVRDFLVRAVLTPAEIDRFLDPAQPSWAQFDSQLGYLPHDSRVPDGIDGAVSTYRYGPLGERQTINYARDPCRIHTYGNSMTQCHQVSDGETWQEYLAAHIGEPIRNFGVGGYGVYQASQRLIRTETSVGTAPYVVLNVFLDDHYRSIDGYRLLRLGRWWRDYDSSLRTSMFHANPWEHVRLDDTGNLITRPNVCPTPESLYALCDPEFVTDTYQDDFVVQLLVGRQTGDFSFLRQYQQLAEALHVALDLSDTASAAAAADRLYDAYAFRVSELIVRQLHTGLERNGQRLLLLFSYPQRVVAAVCDGQPRPDSAFLQLVDTLGVNYIDTLASHIEDYSAFTITGDRYAQRYFNGHYTPAGNLFFAFAVKDGVVGLLDPRPPAYRDREESFAVQAGRLA